MCGQVVGGQAAGAGAGGGRGGIQNQKQEPHTKMWGKTKTPHVNVGKKNRCSGTTRTLDLVFAQAQPEQDDIASSMKIDTQAQPEQDDTNSKI